MGRLGGNEWAGSEARLVEAVKHPSLDAEAPVTLSLIVSLVICLCHSVHRNVGVVGAHSGGGDHGVNGGVVGAGAGGGDPVTSCSQPSQL